MRIKTTITIDENIWKMFIHKAIEKYGANIGEAKKKALDEALEKWSK
ncbi:MAG: hypothetical protein V1870_00750 [Candidatus Aenigmatarchaeota archaeon]